MANLLRFGSGFSRWRVGSPLIVRSWVYSSIPSRRGVVDDACYRLSFLPPFLFPSTGQLTRRQAFLHTVSASGVLCLDSSTHLFLPPQDSTLALACFAPIRFSHLVPPLGLAREDEPSQYRLHDCWTRTLQLQRRGGRVPRHRQAVKAGRKTMAYCGCHSRMETDSLCWLTCMARPVQLRRSFGRLSTHPKSEHKVDEVLDE